MCCCIFLGSKQTCYLTPCVCHYRSGTVNSNMVNSKFHLIRNYCEIFFYNFPNIPCLKYTVNSNFHLIRSKTLPTNDFELTVPDLYHATHSRGDITYLLGYTLSPGWKIINRKQVIPDSNVILYLSHKLS